MKNITVKELLDSIQKRLDTLKGKNAVKLGGIATLVEMAIAEEISLEDYNMDIEYCHLRVYCPGMNRDISFAGCSAEYRPDKRKYMGRGDVLESVTILLDKRRNIPLDLKIVDLPQFLDYSVAKENFDRLIGQQKELMEEYISNCKAMEGLLETMKTCAYDTKTAGESEDASETLNVLKKIL